MSLYALETSKKLKAYGKIMGREEIAKRVLFCAEMMVKDAQYMGAIEFIGRMKALAQACNFDSYWSEKVMVGFNKEFDDLKFEHKNYYYGYCGKNLAPLTPNQEKEV